MSVKTESGNNLLGLSNTEPYAGDTVRILYYIIYAQTFDLIKCFCRTGRRINVYPERMGRSVDGDDGTRGRAQRQYSHDETPAAAVLNRRSNGYMF